MVSGLAFGQRSLTVTSPVNGDFLGKSNTVKFLIRGATSQVRVKVTTTSTADPNRIFTKTQDFSPNNENQIDNSVALNFSDSTPEGLYTVKVEATELGSGSAFTTVNLSNITVDVVAPKFRDYNPVRNSFVKGLVRIRAILEELNVKEWTVKINGQDIPNNNGASNTVNVDWNTATIERDGQQTISIDVEDKARNTTNLSGISVTVDRVSPDINILTPGTTPFRPKSSIPVAIDFRDQFASALGEKHVDVLIKDMNDNVIGRVSRRGVRASGSTLQWTGRIQNTDRLPSQFKIVVSAIDRAGNPAVDQTVIVNLTGR